jgi:hypothetical protein
MSWQRQKQDVNYGTDEEFEQKVTKGTKLGFWRVVLICGAFGCKIHKNHCHMYPLNHPRV